MSDHTQRIAAFDFDGTISQNDSLLGFLRSTHGMRFYLWFAILCPILILYKLSIISNSKAKQIVLRRFYKGWTIERFDTACRAFAPTIKTRPIAITALRNHIAQGDTTVIVSASPENWIKAWADINGIQTTVATKLEIIDGKLTGNFASPNCHAQQKVIRLVEQFDVLATNRTSIYLIAYGDSSGDRAMLDFADEAHFQIF